MAKVLLICGKICSGKSHYAEQLRNENHAVVLSCDEIVLALYPKQLGEGHDKILENVQRYLFNKAADIVKAGCDVVLDWGFWGKSGREAATAFFNSRAIETQWHYIDIDDADWNKNIAERNEKVNAGIANGYYIDQGLMNKLLQNFDVPEKEDMDVWYYSRRR